MLNFPLLTLDSPSKNYRPIVTLTSPTNPSSLPSPSHGPRSASAPIPPTSQSPLPPSPPPPSPTSIPSPGSSARARALRRAARSALVDTYRCFVLPELVQRFNCVGSTIRVVGNDIEISNDDSHAFGHQPERQNHDAGGFCVWILHSIRRRALERMDQILAESGLDRAGASLVSLSGAESNLRFPVRRAAKGLQRRI